jgi:hypothetical protein
LKKQQNKDEKLLDVAKDEIEIADEEKDYRAIFSQNPRKRSNSTIDDFAVLLMPFYDQYSSVPKYFQKLLESKDVSVQLVAARLLIANNKNIPDSLLSSIAAQDKYRAKLYAMLSKIDKQELFPSNYKRQELIARSLLLNNKRYKEFAAIQLVDKRNLQLKGVKGTAYLFKYKIKPTDDWKIGISGLQPINTKKVSTNLDIVRLTDKKLKPYEDETEQFDEQIKRALFAQHKSGRRFFARNNSWGFLENNFED